MGHSVRMTNTQSVEILEDRIAPAGIVTVSFIGGSLHVDGDAADNVVSVSQAGPNELSFTPDATTQVKFGAITGAAGAVVNVPGHITTSLVSNLLGGNDSLSLTGLTVPGSLFFTDATGNGTLNLSNVKVGGSVIAKTGAGNDALNLSGAYVHIGGSLSADLGDGVNSVNTTAATLTVGGMVNYVGGVGADTLTLGGTNLLTGGGIDFDGKDGANTVAILANRSHIGGGVNVASLVTSIAGDSTTISTNGDILGRIKISNGAGNNITTISGGSLHVDGSVIVLGGAGTDSVNLTTTDLKIAGSIIVKQGAGDDTFTASPQVLDVNGGVVVDAGDGKNSNTINTAAGVIGGALSITNGKTTGAGTTNSINGSLRVDGISIVNTSTLAADTYSNSIGGTAIVDMGSLKIVGGSGNDTVNVNPLAITVKGSTVINQGDGTNTFNENAFAARFDALTVLSGAGADSVAVTSSTAKFASVLVKAGDGQNSFSFTPTDAVVAGGIGVLNGKTTAAAPSSTTIGSGSSTYLRVGGAVAVVNGDGGSNASLNGVSRIDGSVIFKAANATAGNASFSIGGADHNIGGGIFAITGAGADSFTVNAQNVVAGGAVFANLGAGNDSFSFSSSGKVGSVLADLGTGSSFVSLTAAGDPLRILGAAKFSGASAAADTAALTVANVVFNGTASIKLGDAPTTVNIDDVLAKGAVSITTGAGVDSIKIEQAGTKLESVFEGIVNIITGAGNDSLLIGKNTAADKAIFAGKVLLDGGAGLTDTATVKVGNTYIAGQPVNVGGNFETFN